MESNSLFKFLLKSLVDLKDGNQKPLLYTYVTIDGVKNNKLHIMGKRSTFQFSEQRMSFLEVEISVSSLYRSSDIYKRTVSARTDKETIDNEGYYKVVTSIMEYLDGLKLCVTGDLTTDDSYNDSIIALHEAKLENIVLSKPVDICCVCDDMTQTKTKCNHSICLRCFSNIRERPEINLDNINDCPRIFDCSSDCSSDCDCLPAKCPLCRKSVCRIE